MVKKIPYAVTLFLALPPAVAALPVACGGTVSPAPDASASAVPSATAPTHQGSPPPPGYGQEQCFQGCINLNCGEYSCDRSCWQKECTDWCALGGPIPGLACDGGAPTTPCTDLQQQGTKVQFLTTKAAAATPEGGQIADGTYVLTAMKLHRANAPEGENIGMDSSATFVFENGAYRSARTGNGGSVDTTTGVFATSGVGITMTPECVFPARSRSPWSPQYTATPTRLVFYSPYAVGYPDISEIVYDRVNSAGDAGADGE